MQLVKHVLSSSSYPSCYVLCAVCEYGESVNCGLTVIGTCATGTFASTLCSCFLDRSSFAAFSATVLAGIVTQCHHTMSW